MGVLNKAELLAAGLQSGLSDISVLPDRRLPNFIAPLGDSRPAAVYVDSSQRGYTANSALNWANARLGQRFIIGPGFGKSGDRTDQVLTRLPAAIASGAGILYIQCGLNDISQNFPTATTSGATAFANTKTMIDAGRAAGTTVIVEAELGANNLNATQVGQVAELNALLFDYWERTPGLYISDARPNVLKPNFGDTAIQFKDEYSYDNGIHLNGKGCSYACEPLMAILGFLVPERSGVILNNRIALPANSRRQLLANPIFNTTTGGNAQTGITGSVPANFGATVSGGGATATVSTQADVDGLGNNVVIDATFTAANSQVRLFQDVSAASYQAGDVVQGVAVVEIVGTPNNLAALMLQMTQSTGSGGQVLESFSQYGTVGPDAQRGPDRAMRITLQTRPFVLQPAVGTGSYLQLSVRGVTGGSGGAKWIVRQMSLKRRDTAY